MALLIARQRRLSDTETLRLVSMLLVHDLAEVVTGDIVTAEMEEDERAKVEADKFRQEREAITKLAGHLGEDGSWIAALWLEFEAGVTPTAKIARQLDKLDCIVQAKVYADSGQTAVVPRDFANRCPEIQEAEFLEMLQLMGCR